MKKAVLMWMTAVLLVLGASAAGAIPVIYIDDLGEGAPVVTSSGFPSIPLISNPIVATLDEFANITGVLTSNFIAAGAYGFEMLDPASEGGGVSDFFTLLVSPVIRIPFDGSTQAINLTFFSDGAAGYDLALQAFELAFPNAPSLVENGTLQNIFSFDGLQVYAASEVVIPVPGSVLLFGSGLLGLLIWRTKRQS
ncbi:MAG: PEP-CTERM sorting domain-containing protein [Desulfobaccales bacterium]